MPTIDGALPPRARQNPRRRDLAARYAPLIHFDRNEPFLPLAAGYTFFRSDGDSLSFKRRIELTGINRPPAAFAIEYAIWWDWDIQHLYELEHTWTYVGESGEVVYAEASWHGGFAPAVLDDGRVPLHEGHPVVYSQPGKHAFVPLPDPLLEIRHKTAQSCGAKAGSDGLLVTSIFKGILDPLKTPQADTLANAYLKAHTFTPASVWDKDVLITRAMLVPWPALFAWAPARIAWCLRSLS
jgi:hypothetical protein